MNESVSANPAQSGNSLLQNEQVYVKQGALDVEQCEQEPIQFIGALQKPYLAGMFLRSNMELVAWTDGFHDFCGLDRNFTYLTKSSELVPHFNEAGIDVILGLRVYTEVTFLSENVGMLRTEDLGDYIALLIDPDLGHNYLETKINSIIDFSNNVNSAMSGELQSFQTITSSFTEYFRELSGFDRVMVYKFDDEWNGEIISESSVEQLRDRFIGLTFPSSDIPRPARELFLKNRVRFICDVDGSENKISFRGGDAADSIDIGALSERAVSPVHLQYLRNMGVKASLTIALIVDSKLWGLLTCHNYQGPKKLSTHDISVCKVVCELWSNLLAKIQDVNYRKISEHYSELETKIRKSIQNFNLDSDPMELFQGYQEEILNTLGADGCIFVTGENKYTIGSGKIKSLKYIEKALFDRRIENNEIGFITNNLVAHYPSLAEAVLPECAGILFVRSADLQHYIIAWKEAAKQLETWAGDPNKNVSNLGRLSPRGSFELFSETSITKSLPWHSCAKIAAKRLLSAISDGIYVLEKRRAEHLANQSRMRAEKVTAELEHAAMHDALTGLPNRRYLAKFLEVARANLRDKAEKIAIIQIDLDGFKQINDTLGHEAGDQLLKYVATQLNLEKWNSDFIARVGGDEFILVAKNRISESDLSERCRSILNSLSLPYFISGKRAYFGASMGIAYSRIENDLDTIVSRADIALYEAKRTGKNKYVFSNTEIEGRYFAWKELIDDVLRGYENDEFEIYFQTQFEKDGKSISGAEALLRWNHPTKGILAPGAFINAADDTGVLGKLFDFTIRTSLNAIEFFNKFDIVIPKISVNISAKILQELDVKLLLSSFPDSTSRIAFEIIETSDLDNLHPRVQANIESLRDAGFRLKLDDFGAGHTSIIGLLNVRPDTIKIDRKLTANVENSPGARKLLKSIIEIAKNLKISVVAEGVENYEQFDVLREIGVDRFQGYYFSTPKPVYMIVDEFL